MYVCWFGCGRSPLRFAGLQQTCMMLKHLACFFVFGRTPLLPPLRALDMNKSSYRANHFIHHFLRS